MREANRTARSVVGMKTRDVVQLTRGVLERARIGSSFGRGNNDRIDLVEARASDFFQGFACRSECKGHGPLLIDSVEYCARRGLKALDDAPTKDIVVDYSHFP